MVIELQQQIWIMKLIMAFIFSLVLFVSFASLSNMYVAKADDVAIEIYPPSLNIMIRNDEVSKIPNATLYITARGGTLVRISINATDLVEEANRQLWIPAEAISFSKNGFNLTDGNTTSVKIRFSFRSDQAPGSYVGKVIIWSENGSKAELSITIKLRVQDWQSFILIAVGVVAHLLISASRWHLENKDSAKTAIDSADSAIKTAAAEKRTDVSYLKAIDKRMDCTEYNNVGDFRKAKDMADEVEKLARDAKSVVQPTDITDVIEFLKMAGPVREHSAKQIIDYNLINKVMTSYPNLFTDVVPNYAKSAVSAIKKAKGDGREDAKYYEAISKLKKCNQNFKDGDFANAEALADEAKNLADSAIKPSITIRLEQQMQQEVILWEIKLPVIRHIIERSLRTDGLIYIAMAITIIIVMIQAWQAFYPKISDFGASLIDYVTAFIFGFSGQTFIDSFIDLGKRLID